MEIIWTYQLNIQIDLTPCYKATYLLDRQLIRVRVYVARCYFSVIF